jgi:hypothetical protein
MTTGWHARSPAPAGWGRPTIGSLPPRVLIITASFGEGRDLAAGALADQLREERPGVEIETADCITAMGRTAYPSAASQVLAAVP